MQAVAAVGAALLLSGCSSSSSSSYGGSCVGSCYEPPFDSGLELADATVAEAGEQDDASDAATAPDVTSEAASAPDSAADASSGPSDAGADGAAD
jgi:hypothetical protein